MIPRDAAPAHLARKLNQPGGPGSPGGPPPSGPMRYHRCAADYANGLFFFCLLISLIAHLLLAYRFYNVPLGRIDPSLLGHREDTLYVQRRQDQDIMVADESSAEGTQAVEPLEKKLPDVADLSAALLADKPTPKETPTTLPPVEVKPVVDQRPEETPGGAGVEGAPPVTLPDAVRDMLAVRLDVDVKYQEGDSKPGAGTGSGFGVGPGTGEGTAVNILAASRLMGGSNPQPPKLEPPKFQDNRTEQVVDERLLPAALPPPDIDFTQIALQGTTQLDIPEHLDADFDYFVTRYIPPQQDRKGWFGRSEDPDDDRPYFRVDVVPRKTLKRLHTMPKDLVILIDTSGSVPQTWVDQIVRGVRDGLATLNEGDRFNIVFFNQNAVFFNPNQIVPFNDETFRQAQAFLTDRKSDGYTDVNAALSRLLVRDLSVERVYNLVLISDGRPTKGVLDTRDLINLITRDNDLVASIYAVGVTGRQNRELLEFLAYRNKGFCVFSTDEFSCAQDVRDLLSRLRYPIMKDVRVSVMGVDPEDVYPEDLPNLHQGEKFVLFGRYDRARPFTMRLVGHNGKRLLDLTFTKDLAIAETSDEKMSFDWAFWKLHHLYSEMIRKGDTEEIRKQIDYLARKYKLKTY